VNKKEQGRERARTRFNSSVSRVCKAIRTKHIQIGELAVVRISKASRFEKCTVRNNNQRISKEIINHPIARERFKRFIRVSTSVRKGSPRLSVYSPSLVSYNLYIRLPES